MDKPKYEVNIDFDEASKAWMRNKKKTGNGCYQYFCGAKKRTKPGYCKNLPPDVQRRKKLMKTPGSEHYTAGVMFPLFGFPWERCGVHKRYPPDNT
jgi:hypothetical protein